MLINHVPHNDDRSFLKSAQDGMKEWWALMEERGTRNEEPCVRRCPLTIVGDVLEESGYEASPTDGVGGVIGKIFRK